MYENDDDKFARLNPDIKFWRFERDGDITGIITGFYQFEHPQFGEQHTVIVRLKDTDELISAFINCYLQEGIRRQKANVGDAIMIQFLGKQPDERFNRYYLVIKKNNTAF